MTHTTCYFTDDNFPAIYVELNDYDIDIVIDYTYLYLYHKNTVLARFHISVLETMMNNPVPSQLQSSAYTPTIVTNSDNSFVRTIQNSHDILFQLRINGKIKRFVVHGGLIKHQSERMRN